METRVNSNRYSEEFRMRIVHLYYTSDNSYRSLAREYNVPRTTIEKWIVKERENYKLERDFKQDIRTFASKTNIIPSMKQKKLTPSEMDKRIKELEKELEYERMKAITYDTMIDVAEEMFKIPIRKKPGAKQFKK